MRANLISVTPEARELLIFTKSTRLTMSPGLLDEIRAWPEEKKAEELAYMARTIPSSWEFVDYVFMIEGVSRAFTHQFVRTRHGSYAQQTMRILDVGDFDYVYTVNNAGDPQQKHIIDSTLSIIRNAYKTMVHQLRIPVEDARGILPTNISTNIVAKFNLRTLAEMAKSRTGGRTQSEYRDVINAMLDEVLRVHPWADQFLFAHGRDFFGELEDCAANIQALIDVGAMGDKDGGAIKTRLLKAIDAIRKEVQ